MREPLLVVGQLVLVALDRRRSRSSRRDTGRARWPCATSPPAIGFSERSTFSFSSRSALASSEAGGSIATRQSELHHVVLDHVAQRAALVVVAARAGADRFGHRELDVVDVGRVPDRLEEDVGEAQRQQVLHRLFAEVVIDAVDLIFLEDLGDGVVDLRSTTRGRGRAASRSRRGHRGDSSFCLAMYSQVGPKRSGAMAR